MVMARRSAPENFYNINIGFRQTVLAALCTPAGQSDRFTQKSLSLQNS
jgi:hypothetical protein